VIKSRVHKELAQKWEGLWRSKQSWGHCKLSMYSDRQSPLHTLQSSNMWACCRAAISNIGIWDGHDREYLSYVINYTSSTYLKHVWLRHPECRKADGREFSMCPRADERPIEESRWSNEEEIEAMRVKPSATPDWRNMPNTKQSRHCAPLKWCLRVRTDRKLQVAVLLDSINKEYSLLS
jgi:hypothetical protein